MTGPFFRTYYGENPQNFGLVLCRTVAWLPDGEDVKEMLWLQISETGHPKNIANLQNQLQELLKYVAIKSGTSV